MGLQANCIESCINQGIGSKYNCSIPSYYEVKHLRRCVSLPVAHSARPVNYDTSVYEGYISRVVNLTGEFEAECERLCPRECGTTRFGTTISTEKDLRDTVMTLNFFVSEFSSLVVCQIAKMDMFALVSSVGGTLGLFVGLSFLSFFEFFEFCVHFLQIVYSTR